MAQGLCNVTSLLPALLPLPPPRPHVSSSRYDPEQRMTANEALNHPFFRLPLAPSAPALPHTSSASLPPVGSEPSSEA